MKILITSHGSLCTGMLESYEMLAGKALGITALPLTPDDTGQYQVALATFIDSTREQLLILCDIPGGTPYNESYRAFLENPDKLRIVSGLNLPMLLTAGLALNQNYKLDELAELAAKAANESITIPAVMPEVGSEIEF